MTKKDMTNMLMERYGLTWCEAYDCLSRSDWDYVDACMWVREEQSIN
ncbi:hypothetical protein ACT7V1_004168 [Salmonella enterica subsp. enterica]|nr:hypothetical protein [Salmonella enterica]EGI6509427.1 hypothetical protein [Salmonella enterica subsp. enterica serovar Durham]EHW9667342.1 hypothetical protein [Salmonella enterica subsp. enterica serovar Agbeni]EDW9825727.1 hypothetical protein [Salmonella enterica]EGG4120938.1 hypothetical protein [Salmonella enterica]EGG4134909.1 hypothetical protein [Salmonella enterica]